MAVIVLTVTAVQYKAGAALEAQAVIEPVHNSIEICHNVRGSF